MSSTRPITKAFNQGELPTIACFNKATDPIGVDFDALIAAMQAYVDQQVVPVWNTPATLVKTTDFVEKACAMVFLDDADQPGALAYHDLTPDRLPLSKVFVKTTIADEIKPSPFDTLKVQIADEAGNALQTLHTFSNVDATPHFERVHFDVSVFLGPRIQAQFVASEDGQKQTFFFVDSVQLVTTP